MTVKNRRNNNNNRRYIPVLPTGQRRITNASSYLAARRKAVNALNAKSKASNARRISSPGYKMRYQRPLQQLDPLHLELLLAVANRTRRMSKKRG